MGGKRAQTDALCATFPLNPPYPPPLVGPPAHCPQGVCSHFWLGIWTHNPQIESPLALGIWAHSPQIQWQPLILFPHYDGRVK